MEIVKRFFTAIILTIIIMMVGAFIFDMAVIALPILKPLLILAVLVFVIL